MQRKPGVFASLLAELREERDAAELAPRVRDDASAGRESSPVNNDSIEGAVVRYLVQLPLPGVGARGLVVAREETEAREELSGGAEDGERPLTPKVGRHEQRPPVRRRHERMQGLKARRQRSSRAVPELVAVDELYELDEGFTRCVRGSFRRVPGEELVIVRQRASDGDAEVIGRAAPGLFAAGLELEVREVEASADPQGEASSGELCRRLALKTSGVLEHMQALDYALVVAGL